MASASPARTLLGPAAEVEMRIYSHSPILFWWPVWAAGLLMALWTAADNYHMALVPEGTVVSGGQLVAPPGAVLEAPGIHVARSPWPGAVFVLTLLMTVFLSTSSLRGPWGLFGMAVLAALALLLNSLDWWAPVLHWLGLVRIYLNLGAYLAVAVPLLVMWGLTVFFFDRRTYLVFSTGQVRLRDELGDAERVYDTGSVSFEKEPYDWLRFLAGFGAGDLRVRVGGPHPALFELPNVIRVGGKMARIEERLRTRDVV